MRILSIKETYKFAREKEKLRKLKKYSSKRKKDNFTNNLLSLFLCSKNSIFGAGK